jgi:hypothetical protein
MDACEPRVRRRGLFMHVETPELDHMEHESVEGLPARPASRKPTHAIRISLAHSREHATDTHEIAPKIRRSIRSASATDSHLLARTSR